MPSHAQFEQLVNNMSKSYEDCLLPIEQSDKFILAVEILPDDEFENKYKISSFSNLAFPMVRRLFSHVVGMDLVSVQPLSAPTGQLFYLDYNYIEKNEEPTHTTEKIIVPKWEGIIT